MSIPLVQNNEKDSINISIIAIKRNIERINMLLGLSNSEEIDTSEFVKKSDIVDVVEAGNMNPVTSNAVVPVDEVTLGNMQSVTSNAVVESLSYSTTEQKTGGVWIDGKPIYRKVIDIGALPNTTSKSVAHNISNLGQVVTLQGVATNSSQASIPLPYVYSPNVNYNVSLFRNGGNITVESRANVSGYYAYATIEYTKTTD